MHALHRKDVIPNSPMVVTVNVPHILTYNLVLNTVTVVKPDPCGILVGNHNIAGYSTMRDSLVQKHHMHTCSLSHIIFKVYIKV